MVEKKQITRRQFLVTGASIVGASALCMSGAGLAIREPQIDYYSSTGAVHTAARKNVLVAYATKAGSTGETAGVIGNRLLEIGYAVDVKPVDDIADVSAYQAVIIGSPVRASAWLQDAVDFVKTFQHSLSKVPVAYFTCSITVISPDTDSVQEKVETFLTPVYQEVPQIKPVSVAHFAGVLDFDKLPFAYRIIWPLTPGGEAKAGDYRDWNVINNWADSLTPMLV